MFFLIFPTHGIRFQKCVLTALLRAQCAHLSPGIQRSGSCPGKMVRGDPQCKTEAGKIRSSLEPKHVASSCAPKPRQAMHGEPSCSLQENEHADKVRDR